MNLFTTGHDFTFMDYVDVDECGQVIVDGQVIVEVSDGEVSDGEVSKEDNDSSKKNATFVWAAKM